MPWPRPAVPLHVSRLLGPGLLWCLVAAGGLVAVLTGAVSTHGAGRVLGRTGPVLLFVLGITVVATLADRAGVFAVAAHRAAVLARGSRWRLWGAVVVLAVACTAVLSLDTTAVLLTPVVLALAVRTRTPAAPFALATVWLASTASLLLPVSNLTNLLAVRRLGAVDPGGFVALAWAPALVGVLVPVAALAWVSRHDLAGRYDVRALQAPRAADPLQRRVATGVCLALPPALVSGVPVEVPALLAATVLLALAWWRDRARPRGITDLPLLVGVLGLFLLAEAATEHGLPALLSSVAGTGESPVDLLRVAAVGAAAANVVDNLPAYAALESVAGSSTRLVALLVGTNLGPLVTPWACLATLLWARACRAAGVPVDWRAFARRGCLLVPVLVLAAVAALALAPGGATG